MSDDFGLLRLPATGPFGDPRSTPIGDPMLLVLAEFLRGALNHDLKAAWGAIHPATIRPHAEPLPVAHIFTHDPDDGTFETNKLPALFVWRQGWARTQPFTQDWHQRVTTVTVLWVPPPATLEQQRFRQPFRNAIASSVHRNVERQRTPGWIASGDTDPNADDYGSFVLPLMKAAKMSVVNVKPMSLQLEKANGMSDPFDALTISLDVTELILPVRDDYAGSSASDYPDNYNAGLMMSVSVGDPLLTLNTLDLRPAVTAVLPITGPAAGGTPIQISGRQFSVGGEAPTSVRIGAGECTGIQMIDDNTLLAVTPAGVAGAPVAVVVELFNGVEVPLPAAFTFT